MASFSGTGPALTCQAVWLVLAPSFSLGSRHRGQALWRPPGRRARGLRSRGCSGTCSLAGGDGPGSFRKRGASLPGLSNLSFVFSRYAASGGRVLCLPSDPLSERAPHCRSDARHCCHPCANHHRERHAGPRAPSCRPSASRDAHHPRGPSHAARRQGERPRAPGRPGVWAPVTSGRGPAWGGAGGAAASPGLRPLVGHLAHVASEGSGRAREVGPLFPPDAQGTTAPDLQVTQLVRAGCTRALQSRPPQCTCPRGEVVGEEGGGVPAPPHWLSGGQHGASGGLAVSCGASSIGHPHRQREHRHIHLATCRGASRGRGRPTQSGLGVGEDCRAPCPAQSGPRAGADVHRLLRFDPHSDPLGQAVFPSYR